MNWITLFRMKLAERRIKRDLLFMSKFSPLFEWLIIQEIVKKYFLRVNSSWENEDLSSVTGWMTESFWKKHQQPRLQRWERDDLINILDVKQFIDIKPILFEHKNEYDEHDGSRITLLVKANLKNYLQNKFTGIVTEGNNRRYKKVELLLSMTFNNGVWQLSGLDDRRKSCSYIKTARKIPKIETSIA